MTGPRVVTVAADPDREAALAPDLSEQVELVLRCVDRVELLAAIRGAQLDAVIAFEVPPWFDKQCVSEAADADVALVILSANGATERLMQANARVLPTDVTAGDVVRACTEQPIADVVKVKPIMEPRGRLVAVWGPKGAPGRTRVALELAAQMHSTTTLLIDGDPYGGDILQLVGVVEDLPTIVWATRMAAKDELDPARLTFDLKKISDTGPALLPGLPRADLWAEVSEFGWSELLTVARSAFDISVVDAGFCLEPDHSPYPGTGEGRNQMTRSVVASADYVVAVCSADPIGLKNFLWSFDQLAELCSPDLIRVVLNRVGDGQERDLGELVRRHTGRRPVAYLADKRKECRRAVTEGVLLSSIGKASDFTASIRGVAASVGGRPKQSGVMSRLSGRAR